MQVPSTTNSTSAAMQSNTATAQSKTPSTASLDYTAFLRLLIAQMQNQDPTNPTDPAQWMGQIASFSNVEQSIQANNKLESLMTSMSLSQADSLIGRTITSEDGSVNGKIKSISIVSGGTVAVLENGDKIFLGAGLNIT